MQQWLLGRYYKGGFNAFEVAELIRKNPSNVIVVGDFYQAHEIAEFIRLGAKVIFIYCTQDNCDIEAFLNKTPPPARNVLSQDNKAGKQRLLNFMIINIHRNPAEIVVLYISLIEGFRSLCV